MNRVWYTLIQAGFSPQSKSTAKYLVELDVQFKKDGSFLRKEVAGPTSDSEIVVSKLDEMLDKGLPVIAGVNRGDGEFGAPNTKIGGEISPTDHFIVIIGRKIFDDGKIGYQFFDPGRSRKADGANPNNMVIQNNELFRGQGYKTEYILGEIRDTKQNPV